MNEQPQPPIVDDIATTAQEYISLTASLFTSQNIRENNYELQIPTDELRRNAQDLESAIRILVNQERTRELYEADPRVNEDFDGDWYKYQEVRSKELENERNAIRPVSPPRE